MTADDLGAVLGIAGRTVRELSAKGVIVKAPHRGRFAVAASIAGYAEHLRQMAAGRAGDAQAGLTMERARQAKEQADAIAMKNAVARGELVSGFEVRMAWTSILTDVRSAILVVPSRLPELTRDQSEKLDRELRTALEDLAND